MKEIFGKVLGHLEYSVLEVLWEKQKVSGREAFEEIAKGRGIALTTVLTVLERLTKKGFVKKFKGQDVFMFMPSCDRDEFARRVSGDVFKGIAEISKSGVAASFVDVLADIDLKELEKLSSLIETRKKELGSKPPKF
ncbi:MAG: BlaI/MecI/CopY family transcriptional regulator [Deltaproteobacteria bacterium]